MGGGERSPRVGYIKYENISFLNVLYHWPIRNQNFFLYLSVSIVLLVHLVLFKLVIKYPLSRMIFFFCSPFSYVFDKPIACAKILRNLTFNL